MASIRQKIITVAGPPGSGKSTMSERMVRAFGFKHISAGECLREEMANPNSKNQQLIRSYIDAGKVIPVEITIELLLKKMESYGWGREIVIIDGFPRNADNVKGWAMRMAHNTELVHMLSFNCPMEVCRERIIGRINECARTDNATAAIENRMKVFYEDTMPIIHSLMMAGKCTVLNAAGTKEDVWDEIVKVLTNLGFHHLGENS
uniref:UMP-CMP kinase, putative n=1 Tax=Babesia bovis TaxID=5865 RepID=S6B6U5_BABBO|nr:UMP-CMP kinase, putative [Babesia bovis]